MIINGGSRRNARFFARHLTNGQDNERVTLIEMRGLAAQTVEGALREMEAIAMGSQCRNYFYHANLNPLDVENLSPEQWMRAIDLLETHLGLVNHARFIVEHHKKGRTHRHVIWLRIDVRTMRVVPMTDDYEKHQATARQLEREFALTKVRSVLGADATKGARPARRPKGWESFRGQRSGIDPRAVTAEVTALYRGSADAEAFAGRLAEHGYRLVQAARTRFAVMDAAGHLHSLARRLEGVGAGELAAFMRDVRAETLPTLAEARREAASYPLRLP
jgi:MobA/VirD2-like, nuclease domain